MRKAPSTFSRCPNSLSFAWADWVTSTISHAPFRTEPEVPTTAPACE